jgi:hypothetical protein
MELLHEGRRLARLSVWAVSAVHQTRLLPHPPPHPSAAYAGSGRQWQAGRRQKALQICRNS